ncbi:hypothetical protein EZ449_13710 [Pedobacter frigidisoli]|uniref:Galactosyltransferase C-terminal domain-containing protein n=1 Tax=Pedobacter frigidisoli TaxID=2530455 RepID=A0A4R0P237_9SPHI|nr:galactosyltransferase-related protein [Pedobacter frigidisoli]TCD07592.1 hypothetical protein EZ449_13710 [Pedobacter frigidisoli]
MDISVITIVRGRERALVQLILGLSHNKQLPSELVIILMNEPVRKLPEAPFPINQLILNHSATLPLAAARNLGAKNARAVQLVFLDVDCIPAPDLIELYSVKCQAGFLNNGIVRYLKKGATDVDGFCDRLNEMSGPDPVRSNLGHLPHELFWSLNFSCSANDYHRIGGFDEAFTGYGGEDTDFAFMARALGMGMTRIDAVAYHQYHDGYAPPLNHFIDIVDNAGKFFLKWNRWPMEGWLRAFAKMGLITFGTDSIQINRLPNIGEIEQSKKT